MREVMRLIKVRQENASEHCRDFAWSLRASHELQRSCDGHRQPSSLTLFSSIADYRSACSSVRSSSSSTTSTTRLATFPTPAFTFDTKATLTLSNGIVTTLDLPSIQAPPTAGIPWTGSYSSGGQVNGDPTDTTSSVTSRETTTLRSDPGTGAAGLVRVEIGWLVGVVVGGAMVGTWVV